MSSKWEKTTVGEFSPFKYGKSLPAIARRNGEVRVYGSNGPVDQHDVALLEGPAIVVGRKGSVGTVVFERGPLWPIDTAFYVDEVNGDLHFAYYLLSSLGLDLMNTDSAVPGLNRENAHRRLLMIPPVDEQRAIASILGAFDDKIELNWKISRMLDEVARASFVMLLSQDDARESRLDELVQVVRDQIRPTDVEPNTPYVGLEHFDGGTAFLSRWGQASEATSGKTAFRHGDVLFGKLRPYFHKVALAPFEGICSTDVMVLRPRSAPYRNFAMAFVDSQEFIARATAWSEGTRMPRAKWGDVASYPVRIPQVERIAMFDALVDPLRARQNVCVAESRVLAAVRDTLLPKLLSGELRISDAEKVVEEVK